MRVIGNSVRGRVGIDFGALARHASYPHDQGSSVQASFGRGRKGGGSYAPLAAALHDTPISMMDAPPKPSAAASPPAYQQPKMSAAERERARVKAAVDRAIEGSYARGNMDRETADALLEGRYSGWLASKRGEPKPPEDKLAKPSFTPGKSPPF